MLPRSVVAEQDVVRLQQLPHRLIAALWCRLHPRRRLRSCFGRGCALGRSILRAVPGGQAARRKAARLSQVALEVGCALQQLLLPPRVSTRRFCALSPS